MELENPSKYHTINWELISKAINYYKWIGYKYIEVPWLVGEEAMRVTFNGQYLRGQFFELKNDGLVGSAEQSFIQLILDNKLKPGNYCTATPCFRFSETEDELHQKYFFKVELIKVLPVTLQRWSSITDELNGCAHDSQRFFRDCLGLNAYQKYLDNDSIDINLDDIEIGSYGYRKYAGHQWIYGTGIAEPRLSIAIEKGTK